MSVPGGIDTTWYQCDAFAPNKVAVLREKLIHIAAVDVVTFGCGSWDHDFMAPNGPSDPQWHGSIPRRSIDG